MFEATNPKSANNGTEVELGLGIVRACSVEGFASKAESGSGMFAAATI